MSDQSIENLLKNLKHTLAKKEENVSAQTFVLKDPINKVNKEEDPVKKFIQEACSKEIINFLYSDEGKALIAKILKKHLESNKKVFEEALMTELKNKIDSIVK